MRRRSKKIWILSAIFGVWGTILLHTSSVHAIVLSDPEFYNKYAYIYILEDDEPIPELTDEQFFDAAAHVTFPKGDGNLPKDAPILQELRNAVIPQLNGDTLQLVRMVMRGAASPEGLTDYNRYLGNRRVQSLLLFFSEHMHCPLPDDILSVDTEIEDYRSLCLMMQRAQDPDYAYVKELCDSYFDSDLPKLKRNLRAAQGGRLWRRLLASYFPQLRTARFVIILRKFTPKPPVVTLPVMPAEPIEPVTTIDTTETIAPAIEPIEPIEPIEIIDTIAPVEPAPLDTIEPRRELLALKTNLLFYAVYMPGYNRWCPIPNVALEYYPRGGHFTYGFSFDMPWWQDYDAHKYFQLRNYQIETRYYLKKSEPYRPTASSGSSTPSVLPPAFSGFYIQAYAHLGLFGICFDADRGWVGEGAGGGLGLGYVMPISRNGHWRLEFGLQAGFFRCKYDPYKYENPIDPTDHDDLYYYKWTQKPELFKKRQYRWNWIGPTRIGVTLSYDLLYRRNHKGGASFKSTERREQP